MNHVHQVIIHRFGKSYTKDVLQVVDESLIRKASEIMLETGLT